MEAELCSPFDRLRANGKKSIFKAMTYRGAHGCAPLLLTFLDLPRASVMPYMRL